MTQLLGNENCILGHKDWKKNSSDIEGTLLLKEILESNVFSKAYQGR